MRKSLKTLIVGVTAFTVLSSPVYAENLKNEQIQKEVLELKDVITKIAGYQPDYIGFIMKKLKEDNYEYDIYFSADSRLELTIMDQEKNKNYEFIDKKLDGILDTYIGSKDFSFIEKNTTPEKWTRLQDNYHRFIRKVLSIAKKVLKEKISSLDEDLKAME